MRRRLRRRPAPRKALTPKSTIWKAPGSDDSEALRVVLLPHGSAWFCVLPLGKVGIVLVPTGNPPSLRFGHPDVTFGRYRLSSLELAGLPLELCGRGRVFRKRPQGVSPDALRCEARRGGASG